MISQWKLRATNCSHLVPLGGGVVAACCPKSAYVINPQRGEELCRCIMPSEASVYALWIPPWLGAKQTAAIYTVDRNRNPVSGVLEPVDKRSTVSPNLRGGVFLLMSSSAPAVPLALEGQPLDQIEDLQVLYHTVLAVITRHEVSFNYLDPDIVSAAANSGNDQQPIILKRIGPAVTLAFQQSNTDTRIVTAWVDATAEPKRFAVVQTFGNSNVWVCRLVIDGKVVVLEDLKLPQGGVPLPPAWELLGWDINWTKGELLALVRQHGGADDPTTTVLSLCLDAMHPGSTPTAWDSQRVSFLSAATKCALRTADDLCCTEKGEVWSLDRTTGPCVSLRHVSSPALKEELLPGSRVSTKVMTVTCGDIVYVLAGCTVYAVSSTSTGSGGEPVPLAGNSLLSWIQQQQLSLPESSEVPQDVTRLVGWLTGDNRGDEEGKTSKHVVRDFTYVIKDGASSRYRHAVLDALASRCSEKQGGNTPHVSYSTALVCYLATAESIHPFTIFKALHHADASLALGIAVILARKANLYRGSFQHAPELMCAAAAFFSFDVESSIEKKRYLATVCEAGLSALAMGALGAISILFCAADTSMRNIYGNCYCAETRLRTADAESIAEMRKLEETITEAINVMSSYSEWALNTAATSLGVMSAHIGEPSNIKKEACVRDGKSHPIATSRSVEIEAFKPQRF